MAGEVGDARKRLAEQAAAAEQQLAPLCPLCGPGHRLGDEGCRHGGES